MKKLICIIMILCLIPLSAMALSSDDLIAEWNARTSLYPAPRLSKDQLEDNVFTGDGWKLAFKEEYGEIVSFGVVAKDTDVLLPMCIIAGMLIVRDYEISELTSFIGKLTNNYYSLKNGKKIIPATFGLYTFKITQVDEGYFFVITGI
jgi:hypothetical protein